MFCVESNRIVQMDKVIDVLANKIASFFVNTNCIPKEKKELYRYSVIVVLQSTITIVTMLLIGALFERFFENICFMIVLKLLRNFSGGLHSSRFSVCYSISIASDIAVLFFLLILEPFNNYLWVLFLEVVSVLIIAMFAPVVNKNKPISAKEYRIYRLLILALSVLLVVISLALLFWSHTLFYVIGITMTLNSVLIVAEEIKSALFGE